MMKILLSIVLILCMGLACVRAEQAAPADALSSKLENERREVWEEYVRRRLDDETLKTETAGQALAFGGVTMRYTVEVIGEKPEGGYPLYIALHGGGQSDTPDINDQQWGHMQVYYRRWLKCGVYVAVRGVRDTWDTHFNPESYPLYDRLIEYMILTQDVDPNRVYLEGFSAGGDGVYAVAPRMADRFAAANMSSGHPNSVNLTNLYNLPMQLQAGEFDTAYDRNTVTAEYGIYLDRLAEEAGGGYEHRTLIHFGAGHNYADYSPMPLPVMKDSRAWLENGKRVIERIDSFPPDWMNGFVREPLPKTVVWDLSTRAGQREVTSFYYLRAPFSAKGTIRADIQDNVVKIGTTDFEGDFDILFNEAMVDFSRPVTFILNGREISLMLEPDHELLVETTFERGDPNYQFEAAVSYSQLLQAAAE